MLVPASTVLMPTSRLVFEFSHDDGVLNVVFGLKPDGVAGRAGGPEQHQK